MPITFPADIQNIITKISPKHQIYLVGGALRNHLLDQEIKDWDFTTSATPEELQQLFPDAFYNNSFGTVTIPLHGNTQTLVEITTMRQESDYQDNRHPTNVQWTDQIEVDLARRDFTINAIAYNPITKDVIDPFDGRIDLANQVIRAVNDPGLRFKEDALRMLRAIRFAVQLDFVIDTLTFTSIKHNAALLQNIAMERIRDEFLKILASPNPYQGLILLRETALLQYFLSELERCFGVVQQGPKHDRIYDIGEHSLLTLKACSSDDPVIRLACLLHDIGKPDTYKVSSDGNVTFYNHEIVGAKIAKHICQRLRLTNAQTELVTSLVRWHMFSVNENQTDSAIRRIIRNIGLNHIDDLFIIREADRIGGGTVKATSWRLENFKLRSKQVLLKPFSITDLKINGQDVMQTLNIPPSRKVGEILQKLFEEVEIDDTRNTREYLLDRMKRFE